MRVPERTDELWWPNCIQPEIECEQGSCIFDAPEVCGSAALFINNRVAFLNMLLIPARDDNRAVPATLFGCEQFFIKRYNTTVLTISALVKQVPGKYLTQLNTEILHDSGQTAGSASVHSEYSDACHGGSDPVLEVDVGLQRYVAVRSPQTIIDEAEVL